MNPYREPAVKVQQSLLCGEPEQPEPALPAFEPIEADIADRVVPYVLNQPDLHVDTDKGSIFVAWMNKQDIQAVLTPSELARLDWRLKKASEIVSGMLRPLLEAFLSQRINEALLAQIKAAVAAFNNARCVRGQPTARDVFLHMLGIVPFHEPRTPEVQDDGHA